MDLYKKRWLAKMGKDFFAELYSEIDKALIWDNQVRMDVLKILKKWEIQVQDALRIYNLWEDCFGDKTLPEVELEVACLKASLKTASEKVKKWDKIYPALKILGDNTDEIISRLEILRDIKTWFSDFLTYWKKIPDDGIIVRKRKLEELKKILEGVEYQ